MSDRLFEFGIEGFDEGVAPLFAGLIRVGVEEDFVGGYRVLFASPVHSFFEWDVVGPEAVVV